MKKHLIPRDIHPGDYVFVNAYCREDNAPDYVRPVKIDIVADNYAAVREGSGLSKYSWSQIYPIRLDSENMERLGWDKVGKYDDILIYANGKVTVDVMHHSENWAASVYYNDGDAHDAHYVHELQDIVHRLSGGTYEAKFDILLGISDDDLYALRNDDPVIAEKFVGNIQKIFDNDI